MARDPRIMYVEERDGKPHVLSDEEVEARETAQRVIFRGFVFIGIVVGLGIAGLVEFFSDYAPSYLGATVISLAVFTALAIAIMHPGHVGNTMWAGTFVFLFIAAVVLWAVEWAVGFAVSGFTIPFFWVLVGAFPLFNNWSTARSLGPT